MVNDKGANGPNFPPVVLTTCWSHCSRCTAAVIAAKATSGPAPSREYSSAAAVVLTLSASTAAKMSASSDSTSCSVTQHRYQAQRLTAYWMNILQYSVPQLILPRSMLVFVVLKIREGYHTSKAQEILLASQA